MEIVSVIPNATGLSTCITVIDKSGNRVYYTYSDTYKLLRDPNNPQEWYQWNGGSLTEAIKYIINHKQGA